MKPGRGKYPERDEARREAAKVDKGNAGTFKRHLRKVLKVYKGKQKIIIYVDNVRFHHAKILKSFLEVHPELEIRYLPPYSPNINPV